MIARYQQDGTPLMDFAATEKVARAKSSQCLRGAIRDCYAVLKAQPDNVKAGYYMDEVHVYSIELARRRTVGLPLDWTPPPGVNY